MQLKIKKLDEKAVVPSFAKDGDAGVDIQFGKHWKKKLSDQTASLDRIDNTKGYIIDNVQWVHKQVNFMKGTMKQTEFIEFCKLISSKCG